MSIFRDTNAEVSALCMMIMMIDDDDNDDDDYYYYYNDNDNGDDYDYDYDDDDDGDDDYDNHDDDNDNDLTFLIAFRFLLSSIVGAFYGPQWPLPNINHDKMLSFSSLFRALLFKDHQDYSPT